MSRPHKAGDTTWLRAYTAVLVATTASLSVPPAVAAVAEITQEILQEYQAGVAEPFSAEAGAALWTQDFNGRSCTSCHSDSVLVNGSHERTGKVIKAMAPSRNPQRLTDRKKIKKWLLRNCKWTLGRECSPREKGDVLLWLSQQ